ncbi:PilZ domain-containing protein [Sphingorhabdus sp.]|uniref:PilZ domain-containing protein n=1 Tax=Sphingorhabdus sp. TaxID=1902408 RepID=UPI0033424000
MNPITAHSLNTSPDPAASPDLARQSDRREHARSIKVMRVARLKNIQMHAECLGMVRDVSSGGMKIDALFPLEVGHRISVALLDDQELTGEIVWRDGRTIGVKFIEEVSVEQILAKPAIKLDGQRSRFARFQACQPSRVTYNNHEYDAVLSNISQRGAKLLCDAAPKMNSNIVIRTDSNQSVAATVKWCSRRIIGVEFHRFLSLTELADWIATD